MRNFILSLFTVALMSACSPDPKTAVIGKWQGPEEGFIMEFRADGIATLGNDVGNYSFVTPNRIKVEHAGRPDFLMDVIETQDELVLRPVGAPESATVHLKKIQQAEQGAAANP